MSAWQDVLAVNIRPGDVTPAGAVLAVETYNLGAAGIVAIHIGDQWHQRARCDYVSVQR